MSCDNIEPKSWVFDCSNQSLKVLEVLGPVTAISKSWVAWCKAFKKSCSDLSRLGQKRSIGRTRQQGLIRKVDLFKIGVCTLDHDLLPTFPFGNVD